QADDDNQSVHLPAELDRVAQAEERRRIEENEVGVPFEPGEDLAQRARVDELGGVGRRRPGLEHLEEAADRTVGRSVSRGGVEDGDLGEGLVEGRSAEGDLREARGAVELEEGADRRLAEIEIDEG